MELSDEESIDKNAPLEKLIPKPSHRTITRITNGHIKDSGPNKDTTPSTREISSAKEIVLD